MTRVAKVRTGDCIVTSTPNQKTHQALGSSIVSFSCGSEKEVLSPPSRSLAMRRERTCFSRGERNQASEGPEGMSVKKPTPEAVVIMPHMRKRVRQGASARVVFLPMPYMSRQPRVWAMPFMLTHRAVREACSCLRHQMEVMVTKAGETAPSVKPRRKRTAAKPA